MKRHHSPQVELLQSLTAFDGCTPPQLRRLARRLEEVHIPSGEDVVVEGTVGHHAFILAEGLAHASVGGHRLATIQPGSFFGELALLDGEPRSATVTTALPSRLLIIDRRAFSALLQTAPLVAQRMLRDLAGRLRQADTQLAAAGN